MENTYWNNKGKHQETYSLLCEALIPDSGNCNTVAGEMLRSSTRLAYDFYNNGMGNNTSGAANFLQNNNVINTETYQVIYEYTRGVIYRGSYNGDALQVAIESMIDQTIEYIIANPHLITEPNTTDMFEFEEKFQNFCDDCGDEIFGSHNSICQDCDESYYYEEEEDEEYEY